MFTKTQKLRLKALLAKTSAELTEAEKTELDNLTKAAQAAGWDHTKFTVDQINAEADPEGLTEDQVKAVLMDALKTIGLDADTIAAIKKSIEDAKAAGKALTADELGDAIKKHLGGAMGVDADAIKKAVKEAMGDGGGNKKGVTPEELEKALKTFGENFRGKSRMEFQSDEAMYPIEHRSGNLTVAAKQLANVCLMHVSKEVIEDRNQKRPNDINDGITEEQRKKAAANGLSGLRKMRNESVYGAKALTAGGVGTGAELVNTDLSSDLLMRLYLNSDLAAEFIAMEIDMPSNPFQIPMTTTRPTFYVGSEGGTPTASTPGTARPTLTAAKLIGQCDYSYEADEDAIISVLPMLQEAMGASAADALEGALINGDTTATHQDSDIHAVTNHHAKLFKGFRKYALAGGLDYSLATGGISAGNIGTLRKNMGKYGIKPRDLIILCGVSGYNELVQLDETLTADKVGSNLARILTGEAPSLYGMRILVSSQVREDLNDNGVYDGSTTTKGSIMIVHKPSFLMGVRRGFLVEVDTNKSTQMNSVIASFRRAFTPKETPSGTIKSVVLGRNYTA